MLARRFEAGQALDSSGIEVAAVRAEAPTASSLGDGSWALAWTSYASDPSGDVHVRRLDSSDAHELADPVHVVADEMGVAEVAPVVAALGRGGGYVVAWRRGDGALAFASGTGAALPPEAGSLELALEDNEGGLSLSAARDGIWFAWTGWREGYSGLVARAFLLPRP